MKRFKGQSAIEYLTTYGWMLVAVAIVDSTVFTTVQARPGVQSVSGLNGDVCVEDFAVGSEGVLQVEVRAATSDPLEISNISLRDPETGEKVYNCDNSVVAVGKTETVNISGVELSDTSNTYDTIVNYEVGSFEDLESKGSITGSFDLTVSECNEDSVAVVPDAMTSSDFEVKQ